MCNSKIYVVQSPPKLGVNLFPGVKAYIQNMSRLTKVEYVRVHLLKNNMYSAATCRDLGEIHKPNLKCWMYLVNVRPICLENVLKQSNSASCC